MKVVWKYPMDQSENETLDIEGLNLRVVHVGIDTAASTDYERSIPCVWVERCTGELEEAARIVPECLSLRFFGTGHPIPQGGEHVGSVITDTGFAWHVYAWHDLNDYGYTVEERIGQREAGCDSP